MLKFVKGIGLEKSKGPEKVLDMIKYKKYINQFLIQITKTGIKHESKNKNRRKISGRINTTDKEY